MANKDITRIVQTFKDLEENDSGRNQSYDEVFTFYGGDTFESAKKKGFLSGIAQAVRSVFQPYADDFDADLKTPINLVKPAIENKVSFLALEPTIRVIEPPEEYLPEVEEMEEGDDVRGADFADRLERVIDTLLIQSNMPARCRDVAWSLSAMGGAVIGAWPDIRHGRPRLITRTPYNFYPVAYDADGLELQMAMWKETMRGAEAAARWGNEKWLREDEIDIIQYIDEEKFCTIIDETEWAHEPIENKMGVVPMACVSSLGIPGMIFGSTEMKDALPVAVMVNKHMALIEEVAGASARPTIAIKDPLNVPEDLAIGRGGQFTMGKEGSVELLGPVALPNSFWQLGQQLQEWFDVIADNPAILRSDEGGGLTTGKGFNAKLGPISARMQTRLEILMSAWRQAIKYMLMMWSDFPGMKPIKASGVKNKETFFLKAEPSEFQIDGEIWTEMEVFLQAQSFMDRQGNAVEIMQLYQNELIDWDTAVDNLTQVTDKKRTRRRIDRDRKWKAEGMAMSQQVAESAMTANVSPAAQEQTNYGLERGMTGETGAMPAPTAQMPDMGDMDMMGAESPMPQDGEDLIDVLTDFFSNIPKLRGSVWFGGDPILHPEKIASDDWTVTVWVTDAQDKGTITRAAENVEVIYGKIEFIVGTPSPDEDAIQVAGGGEGEGEASLEEEMGADVGMGLPPEMMGGGMMGGQPGMEGMM